MRSIYRNCSVIVLFVLTGFAAPVASSRSTTSEGTVSLAIKYVAFKDPLGVPAVTSQQAATAVKKMNEVWKQCGIEVRLENFIEVDPRANGLPYQLGDFSDLSRVRRAFEDDKHLLIVATGTWNRRGTLGSSTANAWTTMPKKGPQRSPFGIVVEKPHATNSNLLAHELGHYLNLLHLSDSKYVMNPIIYSRSTAIAANECMTARRAVVLFWDSVLRWDKLRV